MNTTPWTPETAAATGAAHLDNTDPGWFERITVPSLNLGYCNSCIRGQLYNDFREFEAANGHQRAVELGFDSPPLAELPTLEDPYPALLSAWRDEIARRRLALLADAAVEKVAQ